MMSRALRFAKKDAVLTAAWLLAFLSAFLVHPSAAYVEYIDFRSLGILWSLMVIMQVFREHNVFEVIGEKLLRHTTKFWQLAAALVFLCFFSSMLITNDVALITFVPFSILTLVHCGKERMLLPIVVLQTIAANLGSMMTPIGNPQNLYLYGISGMGLTEFMALVAPYTLAAGALLAVSLLFLRGKNDAIAPEEEEEEHTEIDHKRVVAVYGALFVLALMVVLRVVPYLPAVMVILAVSLLLERRSLADVDYSLLLTFVGFFIFAGNIGGIPAVSHVLEGLVTGHEAAAGVLTSQIISNVPATLLIAGFAGNMEHLILGVNFGGLGTLIASMASLISFKLYAAQEPESKGRYLLCFTGVNLLFLAVLLACYAI